MLTESKKASAVRQKPAVRLSFKEAEEAAPQRTTVPPKNANLTRTEEFYQVTLCLLEMKNFNRQLRQWKE